jgi:DNA-binding XRE family transcriptional regulator
MWTPLPTIPSQPELPTKSQFPLKIPAHKENTIEPVTLGYLLRRRRLDLGLHQKKVEIQIGVTSSTIWNWEHGWTIGKRYIPKIVAFLGFRPDLCFANRVANSELIDSNIESINR